MLIDVVHIARICHEANRALCEALGDLSQAPWHAAPQWQRDSAIAGVEYRLDHPNATPEQQHEQWLAVKKAAGWTHGPYKDAAKKEHPCVLPYEELPEAQKAKDYLFGAIVTGLVKSGIAP